MAIEAPHIVVPLFVPGSRPDRFTKAAASGADAVIIDLEDSVAEADKDAARSAITAHAGSFDAKLIVRINAVGTPWHAADLAAVANPELSGVMLPKVESAQSIANLRSVVSPELLIIALVETAAGLAALPEILLGPGPLMIAFGSIDFALDIGCAHSQLALQSARSELVWRSRAANRPAPLDGVTMELDNSEIVEADARHAASLGFGGKLAVHPNQVAAIKAAFRPDAAAVAWATEIIASTSGARLARVDGAMADRPVIERARRILAASGSPTGNAQAEMALRTY